MKGFDKKEISKLFFVSVLWGIVVTILVEMGVFVVMTILGFETAEICCHSIFLSIGVVVFLLAFVVSFIVEFIFIGFDIQRRFESSIHG